MKPIERIWVERTPVWLLGVGCPSFPANCVSPWSSRTISLGPSFLSSKLKDLRDLPSLTFHDSNSRGGRCLSITTYNPHDISTFSSYSKIDGSGEWWLQVSDPLYGELVLIHLGGETCIWASPFLSLFFPLFSLSLSVSLSFFATYLRNRQNTIQNQHSY